MGTQNKPLVVQATQDEIDGIRGYKITKWHTYNNYECIYCQYATLWTAKMEKHQALGEHPWAYPGQNARAEDDPGVADEPEYE